MEHDRQTNKLQIDGIRYKFVSYMMNSQGLMTEMEKIERVVPTIAESATIGVQASKGLVEKEMVKRQGSPGESSV